MPLIHKHLFLYFYYKYRITKKLLEQFLNIHFSLCYIDLTYTLLFTPARNQAA